MQLTWVLALKRRWSTLTFHSRVLLLFVGVILLTLVSASAAMFLAAKRTGLGLADQQLAVSRRIVQQTLGSRDQQLHDSTNALAADFGFREAVTSADPPTITSALENQRARIHADIALLVDNSGIVIASTEQNSDSWSSPRLEALTRIRQKDQNPTLLRFNGGLLQLVMVPVHAPDTVGWVGMGFVIHDDFLQQLKDTVGVDISLLAADDESRVNVVASTLPPLARSSLGKQAVSLAAGGHGVHPVGLSGEDYLTTVDAGDGSASDQYFVVLQMPMTAVAAPMTALRSEFIASGAVITILCLMAAMLCARTLAQPVRALAAAARSLTMSKRGAASGTGKSDDELAHLANAFHALARRAHYDSLTGLPNRLMLKDRLRESMERMQLARLPLAVVFIDLNGFKGINDTLGHEMGDLVLRKTAQRLSRLLTPPNTVARLGGDEFVLVLESATETEAVKTVKRLIDNVSTPMRSSSGPIKVGMSAGIAMFPELSRDRDELLQYADAAMYQSKTRKRGAVVATRAETSQFKTTKTGDKPGLMLEEYPAERTWSGQWDGKDLSTHLNQVLSSTIPLYPKGKVAPIPLNEHERLAALRSLNLLDTPRSAYFDRVTRIAAKALGVPMAMISLVDEQRLWYLSKVGVSLAEASRDASFCAHAVHAGKPLVVPDATRDVRFAGNRLVMGEPHLRAYAGIPLFTHGGLALGTLCAVDLKTRHFNEEELDTLKDLTLVVEDLIHGLQRGGNPGHGMAKRRPVKTA